MLCGAAATQDFLIKKQKYMVLAIFFSFVPLLLSLSVTKLWKYSKLYMCW